MTDELMYVAGQWSEAVQEDLDVMMNVLEEVLRIITAAESKDDKPITWQIRVQLAGSILDLVLIDTEVCVCLQLPILGMAPYLPSPHAHQQRVCVLATSDPRFGTYPYLKLIHTEMHACNCLF